MVKTLLISIVIDFYQCVRIYQNTKGDISRWNIHFYALNSGRPVKYGMVGNPNRRPLCPSGRYATGISPLLPPIASALSFKRVLFYMKSYVHWQNCNYDDSSRTAKANKKHDFQAAENPDTGNPQLDEEKGETDDEYLNEEEGYSTEG